MLWIPGTDNPVVGLTARCGEMGPFPFLAWGCFQPGVLRPPGGAGVPGMKVHSPSLWPCFSACVGLCSGGAFFGLAFASSGILRALYICVS